VSAGVPVTTHFILIMSYAALLQRRDHLKAQLATVEREVATYPGLVKCVGHCKQMFEQSEHGDSWPVTRYELGKEPHTFTEYTCKACVGRCVGCGKQEGTTRRGCWHCREYYNRVDDDDD
jgi:hypothetical protein